MNMNLNDKEAGIIREICEQLLNEISGYLDHGYATQFFDTTSGGAMSRENLAEYGTDLQTLLAKVDARKPDKIVYDIYTHDQLMEAFRLVEPKDNWKLEINAIVPAGTDLRMTESAITYLTGNLAECLPMKDGSFRVMAAGYYASIGS